MKTPLFQHHRHLTLSRTTLAILSAGIGTIAAQTDGRPGIDSTPSELRPPVSAPGDSNPAPIPGSAVGAAQPIDLDPETVQAGTAKNSGDEGAERTGPNVYAIISASQDFTTLATAIQAAELEEALAGDGPFTLFAPNNEAFEALPEGVLASLLQPGNREILASILSFHVLKGEMRAADLKPGQLETLQGGSVTAAAGDKATLTLQGANITRTDVQAGNGVIHVIDQVLMPAEISVEDFGTGPAGTVVQEVESEVVVEEEVIIEE